MIRRWIWIVALLLLMTPRLAARRTLPATDSLSACQNTLGTSWTAVFGAITDWTESNNAGPCGTPAGALSTFNGADFDLDYWNADSFTTGQYSQVVVNQGGNGYQGVCVNLSAGPHGYCVIALVTTAQIYRWNTSRTSIASCSLTWTNGHTLKLSNDGSGNLTAYNNGVSFCTVTDTNVTGGSPGIAGYVDSASPLMFTWQGDNVGGGGSAVPPALFNAPIRCCRGRQ